MEHSKARLFPLAELKTQHTRSPTMSQSFSEINKTILLFLIEHLSEEAFCRCKSQRFATFKHSHSAFAVRWIDFYSKEEKNRVNKRTHQMPNSIWISHGKSTEPEKRVKHLYRIKRHSFCKRQSYMLEYRESIQPMCVPTTIDRSANRNEFNKRNSSPFTSHSLRARAESST